MAQHGHTVRNALDILTKEEVYSIHQGALDVLENTGVVFNHDRALDILHNSGCKVDRAKKRVRFPSHLVEECLRKCPSSFTIKARNPKFDMRVGDPVVYFSVYPAHERFDLETFEKRPPTVEEYLADLKVQSYLDQVHWAGYASGSPRAEGATLFPTERIVGNIRNSEKAGYLGADPRYVSLLIKINTVLGSTGLTSVAASPPLTWYGPQIEILLTAADAGFPLKPVSGLTAGANGPATLAGALVQSCAEVMSAVVLAQVFKPGIPVIAQDYSQPLDMRTGAVIQGGVERGLLGAAWCQIWRTYGIPRMTMISSDAKVPDYQCAMEKVMSVTMHALAGSNIITFMGGIYDELTGSPLVTIIDNDVAHMVGRLLRGVTVDDRTLAVDLIKEVGPIPGHFLNKKHTKDSWKQEQLVPALADRMPYPEWVRQGKKDIIARAKEKYNDILAKYEPMPVTAEQEKEIQKILNAAGI